MSTLLTPKYLTEEICRLATETAFNAVMGKESPIFHISKRYDAAIIVLAPAMKDARAEDYPEWPVYPTKPVCILDKWYGDETKWEHSYRDITKCKALQLWTDRNDDRAMVVWDAPAKAKTMINTIMVIKTFLFFTISSLFSRKNYSLVKFSKFCITSFHF